MPREMLPLDVPQMVAWYDEGMTLRAIAKRVGRSTTTVWRRLVAAGVTLRRPNGRPRWA